MKQILVIGGTRFIGKHLVKHLLSASHQVTIATRGNSNDEFGSQVSRIVFDRHNENSIKEKIGAKHYDVVFDNLAYCSNDIEILLPNIKCDKYIAISSTAVYEPLAGEVKESDFDPCKITYSNTLRDINQYSQGKRLMEAAICQKFPHIKAIRVRFPYVIGLDDYTKRLDKYLEYFITRKPLYIDNIHSKMSFIDSAEAGKFLAFLIDQSEFVGAINAASSLEISIYDCFKKLCNDEIELDRIIEKSFNDNGAEPAPYNKQSSYKINVDLAHSLGYCFPSIEYTINEMVKNKVQ